MSFDTNLENRPLVRVLIFLMTFCWLGCAYLVFKKGLASLQFTRGGRFVEYLNGNGHARLLDAQDLGLNLIKETIPETMDSKGYDQFKLLVGNDTLLRTKSLTHMNELIHKVEVIGFKVNRNF
jgi:hypothetical protein